MSPNGVLVFLFLGRFWFLRLDAAPTRAADRRPTGGAVGSCLGGRFLLEIAEEFLFGLLHRQGRFGVGLLLCELLQ
jgi:hypothetical protein